MVVRKMLGLAKCIPLAFLLMLQGAGSQGQQRPPSHSVGTQQALQAKARTLLFDNFIDGDLSIDPPAFEVKQGLLTFKSGSAFVKEDRYTDLAKQPLRSPFQAELRIEMLRRYFASPDHNYIAFWEPYLRVADKIVEKSMVEIRTNNRKDDDLQTVLDRYSEQVGDILQGAAMRFAKEHSLTYKQEGEIRGKLVNVLFRPDPPGAEIYVVGGFLFKTAGNALDDSLWLDVTHGNSVQIPAGDWEYRARWQKDKPWQRGLLQIDDDGTYKIAQKPQ